MKYNELVVEIFFDSLLETGIFFNLLLEIFFFVSGNLLSFLVFLLAIDSRTFSVCQQSRSFDR